MSVLLFFEKGVAWLNGQPMAPGCPVVPGTDQLTVTLDRGPQVPTIVVSRAMVELYKVRLSEPGPYLLTEQGGSVVKAGSPVKTVLDLFGLSRRVCRLVRKTYWDLATYNEYPRRPVAREYQWFDTDGKVNIISRDSACARVRITDYTYVLVYRCREGKTNKPLSVVYQDDSVQVADSIKDIIQTWINMGDSMKKGSKDTEIKMKPYSEVPEELSEDVPVPSQGGETDKDKVDTTPIEGVGGGDTSYGRSEFTIMAPSTSKQMPFKQE